jgi:hypothetical protein
MTEAVAAGELAPAWVRATVIATSVAPIPPGRNEKLDADMPATYPQVTAARPTSRTPTA